MTHRKEVTHTGENCVKKSFRLCMARESLVRRGLITGTSRSHSDTPWSVGLLWTSDQPVAGTSENTQHSQQTSRHRRDSNPRSQQARGANQRVRSHGSWNRLILVQFCKYSGDEINDSARGGRGAVSHSGSSRMVNIVVYNQKAFCRWHVLTYVCMYVRTRICICMCTHVCMYVRTYVRR